MCQDVVNQMKLGRRRRFALLCAALHCCNVISDSGFRSRLAFSNGTAAVTGRKTDRQTGRQAGRGVKLASSSCSWQLAISVVERRVSLGSSSSSGCFGTDDDFLYASF